VTIEISLARLPDILHQKHSEPWNKSFFYKKGKNAWTSPKVPHGTGQCSMSTESMFSIHAL